MARGAGRVGIAVLTTAMFSTSAFGQGGAAHGADVVVPPPPAAIKPQLARAQVSSHALELSKRSQAATKLSAKAFANPAALQTYRQSVNSLANTAKQADLAAAQFSPRKLAYIEFELARLNATTAKVQAQALKADQPVSMPVVVTLQQQTEALAQSIDASEVNVRLNARNGGKPVCNLRGYAIPIGMLLDNTVSVEKLIQVITSTNFDKLTSPTEASFPLDTKWAVWVDEDQLHEAYAKRIKAGDKPSYTPFTAKPTGQAGPRELDVVTKSTSFCAPETEAKQAKK